MEKKIKDIRTVVKNGQVFRVIYFEDGTTDEKQISDRKLDNLYKAIQSSRELRVIEGGKQKGALNLKLGLILVVIGLVCSACVQNDKCTGRNWHKYDECY